MRTIETNLYTFDELDDRAKENARTWFRTVSEYPWYDYALAALNAFCDKFNVRVTDYCLSDDYRSSVSTDVMPSHFRGVKLKDIDRNAMPTGYYMDSSLMFEFYDTFKKTGNAYYAFEQAIEQFLIDVRKDIEAFYSDESVDENIEMNEYEFTDKGIRA